MEYTIGKVWEALEFAGAHHAGQFWKNDDRIPYVNHLIAVVNILIQNGENSPELLTAAALHDVVEDTAVTMDELAIRFGKEVADLVGEMTDDMTLPETERRQRQLETAPLLSPRARKLKLADKSANVREVTRNPIPWNAEKRKAYFLWAKAVVDQIRGTSPTLESYFDQQFKVAMDTLEARSF